MCCATASSRIRNMGPAASPGGSKFTVTGTDLTALMDLIDLTGAVSFPRDAGGGARRAHPREIRRLRDRAHGVSAAVPHRGKSGGKKKRRRRAPTSVTSTRLAQENGYEFYIATTPVPGVNIAIGGQKFAPERCSRRLTINSDTQTNVESLSFKMDGTQYTQYFIKVMLPATKDRHPRSDPGHQPAQAAARASAAGRAQIQEDRGGAAEDQRGDRHGPRLERQHQRHGHGGRKPQRAGPTGAYSRRASSSACAARRSPITASTTSTAPPRTMKRGEIKQSFSLQARRPHLNRAEGARMTKHWGKYRGMVMNNIDPMQLGRLQVQVPDVTGLLPSTWAMPCFPMAGSSRACGCCPRSVPACGSSSSMATSTIRSGRAAGTARRRRSRRSRWAPSPASPTSCCQTGGQTM